MIERPGALSRRFAKIVAIGTIPIVLLLGVLGFYAYQVAFRSVLDLHRQGLVARQAGLAQIASAVRDHVAVMQAYLGRKLEQPSDLGIQSTARGGLAEDEDPGPARGAIISPPSSLDAIGARERLAAAESLFPIERAVHETRRYLKWSYVLDAQQTFVALYPWSDVSDMRAEPTAARGARYRSWFDFSVFRFALPANNPDRLAFWTSAYADAGGSGLMVTHGAPVYAKGVFSAVVASDVMLSYLTDYLHDFEPLPGRFALVDEAGNALADAQGRALATGQLVRAEDILGRFPLDATQGLFGSHSWRAGNAMASRPYGRVC